MIPAGERQRSAPAVRRLLDLIIGSNGRVTVAKAPFTAEGRSYPAGSYIIDLHQPHRGIVNRCWSRAWTSPTASTTCTPAPPLGARG